MDHEQLNQRYRIAAWGAFLILVGILGLLPDDQAQWAILGSGIILMGLNLARQGRKILVSGFSLALGEAAFLHGGMVLARSALGFHIKLSWFPCC